MLLTMSTTHPRTTALLSLLSHWHVHKAETTFLRRLSMRGLEVIALAAAMLFVPLFIHRAVQGVDEIYELLGRRGQSPYATVPWTSIVIAAVLLLAWHIWLTRLSYRTVLEAGSIPLDTTSTTEEQEALQERKMREVHISCGRILGRLVVPCLLLTLGSHFMFQIFSRIKDPRPRITPNAVEDMQEAMGQLYGFR
jgi:hypothetical protein